MLVFSLLLSNPTAVESDVNGDSDGYYPGLDIAHAHARAVVEGTE